MLNNLLFNIKEITKHTNKESHFGRHWGVVAGLQKQIDKSSYSLMPSAKKHSKDEINEQVIATFNVNLSDKQANFLKLLTDQSLSFLASYRGTELALMRQQSIFNQAISRLIQQVFNTLQIYSFNLNSAVSFTELYTTCTKPELVKEVVRYSKHREPVEAVSCYRARFSTGYHSLIVKGQKNTIDFVLIPVEKALALSKAETEYQSIASITGRINESEEVEWLYEGEVLSANTLEALCMKVFQGLIEETKNTIYQECALNTNTEAS